MSEASAPNKEKKKLLTPKQQKILDIVVTSIEAAVIVVCLLVSILVWVGVADNPEDRSLNWFAVRSYSMIGNNPDSLNPGDLMFARKVKSIDDLKSDAVDGEGKGSVIAYKSMEFDASGNRMEVIVTHRVTRIVDGQIYTKGDNEELEDIEAKSIDDVIGAYSSKAAGLGKIILWLQGYKKTETEKGNLYNPSGNTTQFLIILIPLILLFVYNGYVVIKWLLDERARKIKATVLAEAKASEADQEAIKKAALVEFMKAQGLSDDDIAAYFAQSASQDAPTAAEEAPAEEPQPPVEE